MTIKKIVKLSLIGGFAGGLESLAGYGLSFILPKHPLWTDFLLNGFLFTIVGAAIAISIIKMMPELQPKKSKIILSGIIGGLLAGLFFHFGIGLYMGIIIYSVVIGFTFILFKIPKIALRIGLGGILGGFSGVLIAVFFSGIWFLFHKVLPLLQEQIAVISMISMNSIIVYFMNLGMLISIKKERES